MTPAEAFNLLELNRPKHINGIPEEDYHSMMDRREELEAQGVNVL
jgi:hypothetical protein